MTEVTTPTEAVDAAPSPTEVQEATTAPADVTGAAEPSEPSAEEETTSVPPWSKVADLYELEEVPEVKSHLERRDRQIEESVQRRAEERIASATKDWESTSLYRSLAGHVGNILEKVEGGDIDGSSRLLDKLDALVAPYNEDYQNRLRSEGETRMAGSLYGGLKETLSRKERDEIEDFVAQKRPSWPQLFDEYVTLRTRETERKLKAQIAERDDTIGRLKAEGRSEKGPNLAQTGPGGAGINSYEEASRRYNLPIGHPEKISHEQFKEQRQRFGIK